MKNFRFEMTKVYSGIPPPRLRLESGRSYVETNLYPPWIPLVLVFKLNGFVSHIHVIFTVHQQSGEGNAFSRVCLSAGGGSQPSPPADMFELFIMKHPTGMLSCATSSQRLSTIWLLSSLNLLESTSQESRG